VADLLQSTRVDGPLGDGVRVLFYDDGSVRFRIDGTPWFIEEAFLTGNKNQHAIIKLTPRAAFDKRD
jgi:hypothetical protein